MKLRLILLTLFTLACAVSAQSVREQSHQPGSHLYSVIFGITVGLDSKVRDFHVSGVIDPKSGKTDKVDVPVSPEYLDAARKKVEAKHYPPKIKDGQPVEFFTYFHLLSSHPEIVVTDLDQPLDKQP